MKLFALGAVLAATTSWCWYRFYTAPVWDASLGWWAATMVFLLNLWVLGVPWFVRIFAVAASGVALVQQFSHNITTSHMVIGLGIVLITYLLCRYQYAAEVMWSTKTIVVDWLVCTVLIVVTACIDILGGKQYLILALSYFCSSNILSVIVMKGCEALMRWRSPHGARAKYIHNLNIPLHVIPSLHVEQLLIISWMLVFILWGRAEQYLSLPNGGGVAKWQLYAATGFWSSLFAYLCPIIADKHPVPYQTPQELAEKRQQS